MVTLTRGKDGFGFIVNTNKLGQAGEWNAPHLTAFVLWHHCHGEFDLILYKNTNHLLLAITKTIILQNILKFVINNQ